MIGLSLLRRLSTRDHLLIALGLVALQVAILFARPCVPICKLRPHQLWEGAVNSSENSQQIFDWYTPSHIIHDLIFYPFSGCCFQKTPVMMRFALACEREVTWEIIENTPDHRSLRAGTISLNLLRRQHS